MKQTCAIHLLLYGLTWSEAISICVILPTNKQTGGQADKQTNGHKNNTCLAEENIRYVLSVHGSMWESTRAYHNCLRLELVSISFTPTLKFGIHKVIKHVRRHMYSPDGMLM